MKKISRKITIGKWVKTAWALILVLALALADLSIGSAEVRAADLSETVADGASYTMEVGDTLTLYNSAHESGAAYSAYIWSATSESGDELVSLSKSGSTCVVTAIAAGTVTMSAGYDYSVRKKHYSSYYLNGSRHTYSYYTYSSYTTTQTFTITITNPAAELTSLKNTGDGIKLTWDDADGASSYIIYRSAASSSDSGFAADGYSQIGTAVNETSYTDTTANSGEYYYYKLATVFSSSTSESEEYLTARLSTPEISSVKKTSDGVKVSWGEMTGANSYIVYRKVKGGSWTELKTTTKTSYTDTTAKSGKKYFYAVKAASQLEDVYSARSSAAAIALVKTPALSSVKNTGSGVKVSWKSVSNATGYIVYRKTSGGSWKRIKTVSASKTSYTDTKATNGKYYSYKVKAYYKSSLGTKTYSSASSSKKIKRLSKVTISSAKNSSGSIKVSWKKNSKATGYIVYRKTKGGSWKKIKTVKSASTTSYKDKTAKSGTTYYYCVKAYYKTSSKTYKSVKSASVKVKKK